MLPNFLIIGAPRSGTDFLSNVLSAHPDVCMARTREVHFFDYNYEKGSAWYEDFFSACDERCMIGEKTANYLVKPECAQRIKETLNDPKLIVILRDPVDRAYSHYRNHIGWGVIAPEVTFRMYLESFPEVMIMGNYYEHLRRYFTIFGADAVHIISFNEMLAHTADSYKQVLSFLGLRQILIQNTGPKNEAKKIYRLGKVRIPLRIINRLRKYTPRFLSVPLLRSLEYKYQKMSQDDRAFLADYYAKSNAGLQDLLSTHKGKVYSYE
ncbi:MAG: sulfotransferase domain-containing protein [Candidatus Omnitrophica bacterium]|nr:sulfotransferase domain-containing protein [Candidatus Omnitrophota bacterium]